MGALRICCGFVSGSLSVHIHQPRFPLIPIRFLIELLKCLLKPRLAVCLFVCRLIGVKSQFSKLL